MTTSPNGFQHKPIKSRSGHIVMVAYLAPAHTGEKALRVVWVNLRLVAEAMGFLVVDPMLRNRVRRNALADEGPLAGPLGQN